MSNTRVLYWISNSVPSWRTLLVLREKKLDFELRRREESDEVLKGPEILAMNPRGQVPCFQDGRVVVNESLAAMQYLEDVYPEPALMPADHAQRGRALQRFHEAALLYDALQPAFFAKLTDAVHTDADQARLEHKLKKFKKELAYFEVYLASDPPYIAGDAFTLADINLVLPCILALRAGATLQEFPAVRKYVDRVAARQSVQDTWPPDWRETPDKDWFAGLL